MSALHRGDVISGYRLVDCIGYGGFGSVWKAQPNDSDLFVALKLQHPHVNNSILDKEATFAMDLSTCDLFPKFYSCGKDNGYEFIAFELLGTNLRQFQESFINHIVPLSTVGAIGKKMLQCIKEFHEHGLVHRDIKPSNFVFRTCKTSENNICLIDFGLAKKWRDEDGNHLPQRSGVGFRGTSRYASINSHLGNDLGRCDDLWSLFYILIEFANPPLPWKSHADKEAIAQIKHRGTGRLVSGLPEEFKSIADYLSEMRYDTDPDYGYLEHLLDKITEHGTAEDMNSDYVSQYASLSFIAMNNTGSLFRHSSDEVGSNNHNLQDLVPPIHVYDDTDTSDSREKNDAAKADGQKCDSCCIVS